MQLLLCRQQVLSHPSPRAGSEESVITAQLSHLSPLTSPHFFLIPLRRCTEIEWLGYEAMRVVLISALYGATASAMRLQQVTQSAAVWRRRFPWWWW